MFNLYPINENKRFIHYSGKPLNNIETREQLNKRSEERQFKPIGLWISTDDETGWKHWCELEDWGLDRLKYRHEVTLEKDAEILHIHSTNDVRNFSKVFGLKNLELADNLNMYINWKKVAKKWQGIMILPYIYSYRLFDHMWYYGWDCDSGCIWDKEAVKLIR